MDDLIIKKIKESIEVKENLLKDIGLLRDLETGADAIIKSYRNRGRVFFCGNGGSAADAQHLTAELVSRFYLEREALAAEALTVNTSTITAISNDYSYDNIFARQLEANGRKGDVLIGLSTSGKSVNVVNAIKTAGKMGIFTIGLTGEKHGPIAKESDICLKVPSGDTPRIQEAHILLGHILCEMIENGVFNQKK